VVLGCAGLVAAHPGSVVLTVTAGRPGPGGLTDWDHRCGFAEGDDVVGTRRREDEDALAILAAKPCWLDFLDRQYDHGAPPDVERVADAVEEALTGASSVASPLGLGHPDHIAVAAACLDVARRASGARWFIYEDAIYRATAGGVEDALARVRERGFELREMSFPPGAQKRRAVAAYASQVIGLAGLLEDAWLPERYWELTAR